MTEEYQKIEVIKNLIIDSLPSGFKRYLHDPLVYFYLENMAKKGTLNTGSMLVAILESREDIMAKFKNHIAYSPPPQYIVGTQEMIDKLKFDNENKDV